MKPVRQSLGQNVFFCDPGEFKDGSLMTYSLSGNTLEWPAELLYRYHLNRMIMLRNFSSDFSHASFGWCSTCNAEHRLGTGGAGVHALDLMRELEEFKRIDFCSSDSDSIPEFSTEYLWGKARGQMFGILECEDKSGNTVILRAFSCQYNAEWEVEGWVPPVFDVPAYQRIMTPGDRKIKDLGRRIEVLNTGAEEYARLGNERKQLSQSLMKELHSLYQIQNFRGEKKPLSEFFRHTNGPPTGAGDCCAPKLLNHAARHQLHPLGLAEFFWGKSNRSGTCEHGKFYSSCTDKCQPILGFMLCGVER